MGKPLFSECKAGSYCSDQQATKVGSKQTQIFHRTVTTLTGQGPAYTGAKTDIYIIKPNAAGIDEWVLAASTTDGGKTHTFTSAAGADLKQSLAPGGNMNKNVSAQVQRTLESGGRSQGVITLPGTSGSLEKITPTQQQKIGVVPPNTSTGIGTTSEATGGLQEALKEPFKKNTRKEYQDVRYPINLSLENQDCIKFTIVEYKAPGVKPGSSEAGSRIVTLDRGRPQLGKGKDRKALATITLPIPAGIGDRNSADWQGSPLDEISKAFTDISLSAIMGGGESAVTAAGSNINSLAPGGNTSALSQTIASKAAEAAVGSTNILSRQFGNVINPNLELLFAGPSLRSFTFNFKFTPRESREAEAVRKIIRQFKQAMSVKRSESSLLLRSPHTFAISYLSKNTDHPYLNKFKECALTDCSVNYTPDGTYMTYTDSSMTSYELSLTFQELEPIFDDEYYEIDKNEDTSIGF